MIKSLIFAVLQKATEPHLHFDNRTLAESSLAYLAGQENKGQQKFQRKTRYLEAFDFSRTSLVDVASLRSIYR